MPRFSVMTTEPVTAAPAPLDAGTIDHVVNGVGGPADTTRVGQPVYVVDYP